MHAGSDPTRALIDCKISLRDARLDDPPTADTQPVEAIDAGARHGYIAGRGGKDTPLTS